MGNNKEVLEDAKTLTAAALLMKSMTRIETQMSDSSKLASEFDKYEILNFHQMVTAVSMLSGDKRSREYLVRKCNELIRQLSRKYEERPLTLKLIAQIKQATLYTVASHFGRWDELFQMEVLHIMGKINVLEDTTIINETVMKELQKLRGEKE